ncbi:MAG: zinc ribbon domain-containing protein [Xanthomonadales bacterium]|nr:zinc ribbon domain-containing protein [Xanthomonadales bacterium]
MPIYEYRCESCSFELEKLQKISDEKLVDCPQCRQPALKRLVSAAAFRLKGSGWYETDFKKDNKRNLAEAPGKDAADTKPAAKGDSKTGAPAETAKTESKPAAKPTATP